jgi:hypothetical protein
MNFRSLQAGASLCSTSAPVIPHDNDDLSVPSAGRPRGNGSIVPQTYTIQQFQSPLPGRLLLLAEFQTPLPRRPRGNPSRL